MVTTVAIALALASPCLGGTRTLPDPVRGIVLGLHDTDARRSYAGAVREIAGTGANAVSLMPIWKQADVRSRRIEAGPSTAAQLDEALRVARAAGLAVLVAPTLSLERTTRGEWRGTVSPPDWGEWFASYRELLLETARIAERHGAEALLVGSELCSSELQEDRWRALIADTRKVFRGQLSYQANWDHRLAPRFLDALDLVASNGYFELATPDSRPTLESLIAAWQPHREQLVAWAGRWQRPLLLTEVGYPSVAGAASWPWDYTRDAAVDLEAQRLAYEAFFQAWGGGPGARGFFLYDWWGRGGAADRDYTPRGKPAEEVLRTWFARARETRR